MWHSRAVTCRERILEVAHHLTHKSADGTFSVQNVFGEMAAQGLPYSKSTIYVCLAMVMCKGAPSRRHPQFDDLERVSKGVYRLINVME